MRWSISLGRVAGTTVRLHLTFLLFLIWLGAVAYAERGAAAAVNAVSFIVLPIGGVSKLERIPGKPREELIMALAGPAVTLVIALALILALGGLPAPEQAMRETSLHSLIAQLAYANVTLFVFNLLPAFPLDGGRVLRAILARFKGHLRGTELAATIGRGAALLLGLAALAMGNFILLLVAIFVFIDAGAEAGMAQMRSVLFNLPAREIMISEFSTLPPDARVADAADELIRTSQTDFPVVDGSGRLLGLLSRDGIIKALLDKAADARVSEAMRTDIRVMSEWQRLDDGLELLQAGAPAIAVRGADGRLIGLITAENLLEKMMVARAGERRSAGGAFTSVPRTRA